MVTFRLQKNIDMVPIYMHKYFVPVILSDQILKQPLFLTQKLLFPAKLCSQSAAASFFDSIGASFANTCWVSVNIVHCTIPATYVVTFHVTFQVRFGPDSQERLTFHQSERKKAWGYHKSQHHNRIVGHMYGHKYLQPSYDHLILVIQYDQL